MHIALLQSLCQGRESLLHFPEPCLGWLHLPPQEILFFPVFVNALLQGGNLAAAVEKARLLVMAAAAGKGASGTQQLAFQRNDAHTVALLPGQSQCIVQGIHHQSPCQQEVRNLPEPFLRLYQTVLCNRSDGL